jgi:hypothetical protein
MNDYILNKQKWLKILIIKNNFQQECLKNRHSLEEQITLDENGIMIKHIVGGFENGNFAYNILGQGDDLCDCLDRQFKDLIKCYNKNKHLIPKDI